MNNAKSKSPTPAGVKIVHRISYADGCDYLLDRGDMLMLVDGVYLARTLLRDNQFIEGYTVVHTSGKNPYLRSTGKTTVPETGASSFCFSPVALKGKSREEFYGSAEFMCMYHALLKKHKGRRPLKGICLEVGEKYRNGR